MIQIENNIPIPVEKGGNVKYKEVSDTFDEMQKDQSIIVDNVKVVNALRRYAKDRGSNICYRKLSQDQYRVWRIR